MPIRLKLKFISAENNRDPHLALSDLVRYGINLWKGFGYKFDARLQVEQYKPDFILTLVLFGDQIIPAKEALLQTIGDLKQWELISEQESISFVPIRRNGKCQVQNDLL